ncbi:ER membrane protein complex subunit 7-like protein [Drosera capensis]
MVEILRATLQKQRNFQGLKNQNRVHFDGVGVRRQSCCAAMAWIHRSGTSLLFLPLLLFFSRLLLSTDAALSSRQGDGYTIAGRVKIPSIGTKGYGIPGKISNVKVILNGGQVVTFLRPDGYFSLSLFVLDLYEGILIWNFVSHSHKVPPGTHLIEVYAIGYFFSPVRVDVSARNPSKVQAALTETRRGLSELILEPLREEQYYEVREPFSPMSLVKSPMGLMVGFMLIVVFLMPKLMENMGNILRRCGGHKKKRGAKVFPHWRAYYLVLQGISRQV